MRYQFFNTADYDFTNLFRLETDLVSKLLQRFDRRVRIDVASAALDADIQALEFASQAMGEIGKIG